MPTPRLPIVLTVLGAISAMGLAGGVAYQSQDRAGPALPSVTIDFRVLTDDGRPVLDLKPDEVELRIDGRQRPVSSLRLFGEVSPPGGAATGEPPPPPFASNQLGDGGRDVLVLIEDESIVPGREQSVTAAVEELLAGLAPKDRVGLVTIPRGGTNIGFTTSRQAIRDGLASTKGRGSTAEAAGDLACRTRLTLESLIGVFRAQVGREVPTTVVLLSSSLTAPTAVVGQSASLCPIRAEDFNQVADAAIGARVNLVVGHVLDARPGDTTGLAAGLESLAGVTSGQLVRLSGDRTGDMTRVAQQTATYYVVGFEPERAESDGRSHRIDLRVSRGGVKVHLRPHVTIPRAEDRPVDSSRPSARSLLRSPLVERDLPLRAAGYASRDSDERKVKIVVLFESDTGSTLESAMVGLFDSKGKLTAQWTAKTPELARAPVVTALPVPPGTYRIRVAATDAAGRGGTVDAEVNAALTDAPPVTISALALGTAIDGAFVPRLQFSTEKVMVGYIEVYGRPKGSTVAAILEVADTADGPAGASFPARVPTSPSGDTIPIVVGVPIEALPPGDYVIRAVVAVDGKPIGRVSRTLRKIAR